MSPYRIRVFVSGDQQELKKERQYAIIAIGNVLQEPVAWETSGAQSKTPEQWYKDEIPKSEVYVGLFGVEYSEPSCAEFLLASKLGLHRLVFVQLLPQELSRDKQLIDFFERELRPRVIYEQFNTPQDLQVRVERALEELISSTYKVPVKHRSGLSVLDQTLIETIHAKRVAFSREMQLSFEDLFSHWGVYNSLKKLVERNLIRTNAEWHHRWFYPANQDWTDVSKTAEEKAEVVKAYAKHDNSFSRGDVNYDDYSEFLVEQALLQTGFAIESRNTRQFNSKKASIATERHAGRPPDLDLIVSLKRRHFLGVQVKNRLDYPEAKSIWDFLDLCGQLDLRPLFVVRMAPENVLKEIARQGGRTIIFKRWLLRPPFPRDTFQRMLELGIPVSVYRRVPDFLIVRAKELKSWLEGEEENSTGKYTI